MLFKFLAVLITFNLVNLNAATAIEVAPSAATAQPVDPIDQRYGWLGVPVKPLNVQIKADAAQSAVGEFDAFRKAAQATKEKVDEYRAVREFAEGLFGHNAHAHMPHHPGMPVSFSTIEPWISNSAENNGGPNTAMPGSDRVLIVGYDLLAQVLNVRSPKPVTAQQISDYVANAKTQAEVYQRYQLLKQFARGLSGVQSTEVDQLDQWFLENNHGSAMASPHMNGNTARKLKGDLKLVQDLVKAKAGRDIDEEFTDFSERNANLLKRAKLYTDLQKFVSRQGDNAQNLEMLMPVMGFDNQQVFENGSTMPRQMLVEGFEFAPFLIQARTQSLHAMVGSIAADTRLRVFGRFVLCAQTCGVEMYQSNQHLQDRLYTESQVEFRNGLLFQADAPLTTANTTWAMNHEGELRIFPLTLGTICNHSMFFQKDYIGLPIACGGHIELAGGKITAITNGSGHYNPTFLNLVMAVAHLHEHGVMAENVRFAGVYGYNNGASLAEALQIARSVELV